MTPATSESGLRNPSTYKKGAYYIVFLPKPILYVRTCVPSLGFSSVCLSFGTRPLDQLEAGGGGGTSKRGCKDARARAEAPSECFRRIFSRSTYVNNSTRSALPVNLAIHCSLWPMKRRLAARCRPEPRVPVRYPPAGNSSEQPSLSKGCGGHSLLVPPMAPTWMSYTILDSGPYSSGTKTTIRRKWMTASQKTQR